MKQKANKRAPGVKLLILRECPGAGHVVWGGFIAVIVHFQS